ncbi:MAG: malate dehydrogenase [Pseudomonadota bacterium]
MARVLSEADIVSAHRRGRQLLEVLDGDLVTPQARDTAERLAVTLHEGPLATPAPVRSSAANATQRVLWRRSPRWQARPPAVRVEARRLGKVALVGAGGVGANIAHLLCNADAAAEIVLIDVVPGLAESVALDLLHATGINRSGAQFGGGADLAAVAGADVVVVTAGRPRTPGMDRRDLIDVNQRVIRSAADAIALHAPEAVVIVVTNPLDEMTLEMLRATGFPRDRVLGMAGTLDSARFRRALADAAGVGVADVEAITLGSHGAEMAPIGSLARIKGRPVDVFLDAAAVQACAARAVAGGAEVVALRKTGSATIAPAHATVEVIDHLRGARVGAVPVSVALDGEYGLRGVVLGVPCHLGPGGLIAVDEWALAPEERDSLDAAATAIRERIGSV